MTTFRAYMEKQAAEAKKKIAAAKKNKGGLSSGDIQELFRLQTIITATTAARKQSKKRK